MSRRVGWVMLVLTVGWFATGYMVARQRYRARCLTPCDHDCRAPCHRAHEPRHRRARRDLSDYINEANLTEAELEEARRAWNGE